MSKSDQEMLNTIIFSDDELQTQYMELQIQGVIRSRSFEETAIRYGYTLVRTKTIATRIDRKFLSQNS